MTERSIKEGGKGSGRVVSTNATGKYRKQPAQISKRAAKTCSQHQLAAATASQMFLQVRKAMAFWLLNWSSKQCCKQCAYWGCIMLGRRVGGKCTVWELPLQSHCLEALQIKWCLLHTRNYWMLPGTLRARALSTMHKLQSISIAFE